MKKMFGMAILAIFLVSLLPSALAQGGDGQMGQDATVSVTRVGAVQAPEGEEGAPEPALISAQSGQGTRKQGQALHQQRKSSGTARERTRLNALMREGMQGRRQGMFLQTLRTGSLP